MPILRDKRRNAAAEQIKSLILARGLRPGDLMPTETDLCAELGISRSSLREAMRTLTALDIVEVRHGHGTVVGQMSLDSLVETLVFRGVLSRGDDLAVLREVVELRCALDLAMADAVMAAHQGRDDASLAELVAQMIDRANRGETFVQADRQFHTELLAPINNTLAGQMVAAFWDIHTAVLPRLGLALPADLRQTARAHGELLRAAQAGDAAAYRAAVLDHYEPLQRMLRDGDAGR
ncbi:FadR/GntR family transcriptional regulator [Paracoccus sp. (in: a-proteobacteria)]|uniref:FadR/GntR family transcriptional regulator n=1 Tax=Paracoccus sp. TaxID=267 RepID=UPI0026DFCF0B|nr:GntR family transcriptional regulator [Paracoccus sp. (in: a-proteobacteria)]MDO5648491.1 GntR family transcriptional regulator [Paracoccus sp. (in: a-proteobacteria)]